MNREEIDLAAARQHLDEGTAVFVDVRDRPSFDAAHIPGAHHVDDTTVGKFVQEADQAAKVIVYCYHGNMSLGGAAYFRNQGFESAVSMAGGFEAWKTQHPFESTS